MVSVALLKKYNIIVVFLCFNSIVFVTILLLYFWNTTCCPNPVWKPLILAIPRSAKLLLLLLLLLLLQIQLTIIIMIINQGAIPRNTGRGCSQICFLPDTCWSQDLFYDICIYVYIYIYTHNVYVCVCVCVYIYVYICMYVCVCTCTIHIYIYTHIYIHTHLYVYK